VDTKSVSVKRKDSNGEEGTQQDEFGFSKTCEKEKNLEREGLCRGGENAIRNKESLLNCSVENGERVEITNR